MRRRTRNVSARPRTAHVSCVAAYISALCNSIQAIGIEGVRYIYFKLRFNWIELSDSERADNPLPLKPTLHLTLTRTCAHHTPHDIHMTCTCLIAAADFAWFRTCIMRRKMAGEISSIKIWDYAFRRRIFVAQQFRWNL